MCSKDNGQQVKLPKKILTIRDCTFILPDDFEGTLNEAFAEFLKYQQENHTNAKYYDDSSLLSTFSVLMQNENIRVCGEYSILELRDGKYVITDKFT